MGGEAYICDWDVPLLTIVCTATKIILSGMAITQTSAAMDVMLWNERSMTDSYKRRKVGYLFTRPLFIVYRMILSTILLVANSLER